MSETKKSKYLSEEAFQLSSDVEDACADLASAASLLQNYGPEDTETLEFACDVRDAIADAKRALAILETVYECVEPHDECSCFGRHDPECINAKEVRS